MADPALTNLTDTDVVVHTAPLPAEAKILMLIEANAHVTHVLSLGTQAARQLVVGLLEALDSVDLGDGAPDA